MRPQYHHPAGDHGHGFHYPLPLPAIPQRATQVGVTWQFIRKEAQGCDRSQRCEEQSNDKAYTVKRNTGNAQSRSQARKQRPNNSSSKKEKADAFCQGKCRRCGSTVHTLKDCKVAADVECWNCNKAGHLAKICASHIFFPLTAEQQRRRSMVANLIEQGEESDDKIQEASALAVSRRVSTASLVYRC